MTKHEFEVTKTVDANTTVMIEADEIADLSDIEIRKYVIKCAEDQAYEEFNYPEYTVELLAEDVKEYED